MRNNRMKKIILCLLLICFITVFVSCKKDKETIPIDENNEIIKIIANHTISEDDLNIYLLLQSKPVKENNQTFEKQSITIYSDFLKENRTSRHYSYYQVDYYYGDKSQTYYHIFDFTNEANKRSYAQCFLPFNVLENRISNLAVKFEYSYMIGEEVFEKECQFLEDMIVFDEKYNYIESINGYRISIDKVINDDIYAEKEDYNRYKLTLEFLDETLNKDGHIDFTAFVKFNDGNVYPLYSLYHYNFNRGSYNSVRSTTINKDFIIEEIYYVIEEYYTDGTINKIYYKG